MIDAVLGYHTNPATCGVAKFNVLLAKNLGVPHLRIEWDNVRSAKHPLVSIKPSEIDSKTWAWFPFPSCTSFDLFLHGWDEHSACLCRMATRVYAANVVIAASARAESSDVIEAWCPSTIHGNPHRGAINVLTFGMSGKIDSQMGRYEKLRTLLDGTGEDYTVSVSTAIHEGSPWDDTAAVGDRLRGVFDDHLRVLGYLADDALARELRDCSAVALFYDPALRANNTTFFAAADAGCTIITNLDDDSPRIGAYDIHTLAEWPREKRRFAVWPYTWKHLLEQFQEQPCASSS